MVAKKPKKKVVKPLQLSKYEKNTKIVDLVRQYKVLELNNDQLLQTIEIETGKKLTMDQLIPLIEQAKREIEEAEIQVNIHMDYMIRVGLYESTIKQDKMLEFIQKMMFSMIIDEKCKPDDIRNDNLILNTVDKWLKVIATKSNVITNIGYLSRAKELIERKDDNADEGKRPIFIQNKKGEIEDVEGKILEIDNNEVA